MNILYLGPSHYLSSLFIQGWKNAFEALGYGFTHLDPTQAPVSSWISSQNPELILTNSGEGLLSLAPEQINQQGCTVVVGALPANRWKASFDPHTPLADPQEIAILSQLERRLVWSQHEPYLYPFFYQDYLEQSISVLYLPYAADITTLQPLEFQEIPINDFLFIGNLAHRKKGNLPLLDRLFQKIDPQRVEVFGDPLWQKRYHIQSQILPLDPSWHQRYQQAAIAPNLHSWRQKKRMIQVNNRTFDIPLYGGFQITDHPLAAKFFDPNEICIASTPAEFQERFFYYLQRPEQRKKQIEAARLRLCQDHSYFNRIAAIFDSLGDSSPVTWKGTTYRATTYPAYPEPSLSQAEQLGWTAQAQFYHWARKLKQALKR